MRNIVYLINKRYEMYTLELNIDISITLNVIYHIFNQLSVR